MQLYVGLFVVIFSLHSTLGYSAQSVGSLASSTGTSSGSTTGFSGGSTGGNSYPQYPPYADNTIGGTTGGSGGSYGTGSYGGATYGGAYGGSYAGTGAAPFIPPTSGSEPYPPGPAHDYQNLFINFWKSLNENYSKLINQQLAHQAALFNQINAAGSRFGATNGGAVGGGGYYAPNFASSSASLGPQGTYQTANIIPANPNSPNVDTRYGDGGHPVITMSVGPPGFYGVSSSSFSSSSDINGHTQSHREAQTSVNDNGKVTTYTVRS